MKREARRVRLARRQAILAEVRQRAAMRGLADALAEENRSAALAQRSRALIEHYGGRTGLRSGAGLYHSVAFTSALASLAAEANAARDDAKLQAAWQAQALGEAQTRARRQSERLESAQAAYREAREQRQLDPAMPKSPRAPHGLAQLMPSQGDDDPEGRLGPSAPHDARQKRTAP